MRALSQIVVLFALVGWTASVASAQPPVQSKSKKAKVVKKKAAPKKKTVKSTPVSKRIDPLNVPMAGTWFLLDSQDKYVKTTKMIFTKYGEFDFIGSAWRSKGTFTLRDNKINLVWTQVDGKAVAKGTMKKSFPVSEGVTRFQIDRFRYGIYKVSQ